MLVKTGPDSATNTGDEVRAYTLVARHNEIVDALASDRHRLTEARDEMESARDRAEQERARLAHERNTLTAERDALQKAVVQSAREIRRLEKKFAESEARIENQRAQLAALTAARDKWKIEVERLSTGLLEQFEEAFDGGAGEMPLDRTVDATFALCDTLKAHVDTLTAEGVRLREQLEEKNKKDLETL